MKALLLSFVVLFTSAVSFANNDLEMKKIDYLISSIEKLDAKFIRSDIEYSGKDAAKHLRKKVRYALNGFFSPEQSEITARLFIDEIASESSMNGTPYYIRYADGRVVKARDYLYQKLREYQP